MKERPIIMSGPMVRAILEGRKTQTRRVMSPQPSGGARWNPVVLNGHGGWTDAHGAPLSCPYGAPGDRLWVREAFFPDPIDDGDWDYIGWEGRVDEVPERYRTPERCIYRESWRGVDLRWTPSIFMPRWASRLTLVVKSVRVERLQDITEEDARAEGIRQLKPHYPPAREAFAVLWDDINGKRAPWDSNPWVWVVSFEVAE